MNVTSSQKRKIVIGASVFALAATYYMLRKPRKPMRREREEQVTPEKYIKFVDEWEGDRRKLSKSKGLSGGRD
jgi:hypothetical protein